MRTWVQNATSLLGTGIWLLCEEALLGFGMFGYSTLRWPAFVWPVVFAIWAFVCRCTFRFAHSAYDWIYFVAIWRYIREACCITVVYKSATRYYIWLLAYTGECFGMWCQFTYVCRYYRVTVLRSYDKLDIRTGECFGNNRICFGGYDYTVRVLW